MTKDEGGMVRQREREGAVQTWVRLGPGVRRMHISGKKNSAKRQSLSFGL